ncbi:toxin-antitoxin system YwqK family antitoxin [Flavobacterium psychrophilum]|uniref:hypothetical protein n=1 Tax=Flavobacterium psychrophilum TaxID=96345 RepID=UPI0006187A69|nr:hypothetical protein [Flavobacterium psychrophilum]ELM3645115.1 hypothetical protein [Flavobacterium psychrophilum]MCB6089666.1 hypothetical protein [Flavobacterium psychrophilum]OAE90533.1 hypothetical protein SU65_12410 [Flavobacterium psychrophilum]OJH09191.1 hypothetical protein FPG87_13375 [Flavobacterium psychrophilum]OUD24359.1 hypothetical protein FPG92_12720 [Flavobacterium psychrophilum]
MKNKYIIIALVVLFGLIVLFFYFKDEKVYTYKEYSSSGKLTSTNEYVIRNGTSIQNGKFVNYNKKGIKIAEGYFINNEISGKSIYYFDNGKIESVHYRKSSKMIEESTFYNSNGLIRKYIFYNDLGEPYFIIDFDEKGVREYQGPTIKEIYQSKFCNENKHFKVNDILKYKYIVANIPNTKRSFKIENISIDNSKVKRTLEHMPPHQIDVEEVLTKKGKNTIRAVVRYEFDDKITKVESDTITFYVNVK